VGVRERGRVGQREREREREKARWENPGPEHTQVVIAINAK